MRNFEILVTSPPDRDNLVVEIWYNNQLIAEVNSETEVEQIIFYCEKESSFDYNELMNALNYASLKSKKNIS